MKKRSREINVFSVSALDLFASALGAFILMSLIFMVFFAMTSRDSGVSHEVQTALERCEANLASSVDSSALAQCQAELQKAKQAGSALAAQLKEIRIPHLDVVICLDITGSMGDQVESLKQEISALARVLDRLAPSTGIGVVAYGDIRYDRVTHVQPIVLTTSMASLVNFIDRIELRMGQGSGQNNDSPEALDRALAEAVAMNWRPDSERRYVIIITDAPAYPHKEASAFGRARDFSRPGNQYVSTVMVGHRGAESFLRELANSGQGQFVDDVGGQSLIASILLAVLSV